MTQKKEENENGEGGWIDANKGRKNKKNPAAKEQVQAIPEQVSKIARSSSELLVISFSLLLHSCTPSPSAMHGSKPPMMRSGPKQQTNERDDETKQPMNRPNRQHTERIPNERDGKKMVEEVFRLEDEQYKVDLVSALRLCCLLSLELISLEAVAEGVHPNPALSKSCPASE